MAHFECQLKGSKAKRICEHQIGDRSLFTLELPLKLEQIARLESSARILECESRNLLEAKDSSL